MHSNDNSSQQGIVLVSVLWVIALASLLITSFNSAVRTNVTVTRTELDLARLERIGEAGVELAIAKLRADPGERWHADGRSYALRLAGADMKVRIFDANGLIDINHASSKVLAATLSHLLEADQLAEKVHDYIIARRMAIAGLTRDGRPTDGAPRSRENSEGRDPLAFRDVSQLVDRIAMSAAQSRKLRRFLTVHSSGTGINLLTTPNDLLQALPDISSFALAELAKARKDGTEYEGDALSGAEYSAEQGPAYKIVIEVNDGGFARPLVGTATIMTDEEDRVPYLTLARRPFGS